ncbi:MAG: hypothetical protein ABSG84_04165 [Acidobacteriaceae bacterium]
MPEPLEDLNRDHVCHFYQAPTGQRCGSPALKGEYYCYHHHLKHANRFNRRVLIDPEITRMEIPAVEDRASIFVALAAVIHRLAENTVDTRRAGQMIYGLQVALQALPPAPPLAANHHPAQRSQPAPAAPSACATSTTPAPDNAAQLTTSNQQLLLLPTPSPSARRASSISCVRATAPAATPNSSPPPNSPNAETPAPRPKSSKKPDPPCPPHRLQLTTCNLQLCYPASTPSQRIGRKSRLIEIRRF